VMRRAPRRDVLAGLRGLLAKHPFDTRHLAEAAPFWWWGRLRTLPAGPVPVGLLNMPDESFALNSSPRRSRYLPRRARTSR
jgi:hypothetical protein